MHTRLTAVAVTAAALLTLSACSTETEPDKPADAPKAATPSGISQADRDKAREAAGLPPEPKAAQRQAFLNALNAIDPRIVKPGKNDQAVSRGLNQCSSIKTSPHDRDKLVRLALERFTITTRLPDISTPDTGGKVLDAVHKHLCPGF